MDLSDSPSNLMKKQKFDDIVAGNQAFVIAKYGSEALYVIPSDDYRRGGTKCLLCDKVQTEKQIWVR